MLLCFLLFCYVFFENWYGAGVRCRGATGQWVRLVGTWVQFTGYMGAISWYSGATSGYIPTYWQSPVHTFADRFPYLSQLCRKNHCLKPNSRKFNLVHFALEAFSRRQNLSASNKKDKDKMHPAGQILVGSGLGYVQTVFLHDSTLVVLFTAHLFMHLYFHFKLNNRMCFGPPCFPLNFILILFCFVSTRDLQEKTSNTFNFKANRGPWLEWQPSCVPAMHGYAWFPLLAQSSLK